MALTVVRDLESGRSGKPLDFLCGFLDLRGFFLGVVRAGSPEESFDIPNVFIVGGLPPDCIDCVSIEGWKTI